MSRESAVGTRGPMLVHTPWDTGFPFWGLGFLSLSCAKSPLLVLTKAHISSKAYGKSETESPEWGQGHICTNVCTTHPETCRSFLHDV